MAMSVERPELEVVFRDYRHLTDEQIAAADIALRQLEVLYQQVRAAPNDPRKQAALQQLEQRGYQLGLQVNSRKILNDVWRDVQKRAKGVAPPIDEEATQTREEVIAWVRGQSTPVIPETPIRWGSLSAKEAREKSIKEFGFDVGWGW
jgi:hypothetical protein